MFSSAALNSPANRALSAPSPRRNGAKSKGRDFVIVVECVAVAFGEAIGMRLLDLVVAAEILVERADVSHPFTPSLE